MANLVLGLGMSHTPQMSMSSDHWEAYAANDAKNFPLIWKQKRWDYDDLVAAREPEGVMSRLSPDTWAQGYERINEGISTLAHALAEARPDVVVIVGDDHHEMYTKDSMPTLAVYWGETLEAIPPAEVFPTVAPAAWALFGDKPETYRCHAGLGEHLIVQLNGTGFDVAQLRTQPPGVSAGHTYIAVRQRLMGRQEVPYAMVPVIMNTYFPPNTPSPQRSWSFGQALRKAIESYPEDLRVALVASGGLSHFVVDEDLDNQILTAIGTGDQGLIDALDPVDFVSGTSESLCWIAVGGACADLDMEVVAYVPGYRTAAGSGTGMAAAVWSR